MEEFFERQQQYEDMLNFRYPWFNVFYNYLVAVCVLLLFASFIWWGIDIHTRHMAEAMTESARASWEADQQARETAAAQEQEAIRASQEFVMQQEATALAKAFYGIRLFREKYNYSEADLATYARCIFNRAEGGDLIAVVSAKDQFTGYSDNNAVLTDDYNLALRLVEEWHSETVKPCDVAYQFAELTPDGIYLKKDLHADAYQRRWQA